MAEDGAVGKVISSVERKVAVMMSWPSADKSGNGDLFVFLTTKSVAYRYMNRIISFARCRQEEQWRA